MPQPMTVVPAEIRAAGQAVDCEAKLHHARVGAALARSEAATRGVPAAAGAALTAALTKWSADHQVLINRMASFGGALQGFSALVTDTDDGSSIPFRSRSAAGVTDTSVP